MSLDIPVPPASTAPGYTTCAARSAPWVLAASVIASSMGFIDQSVVNLALPVMQAEFSASLAATQWIVEAYILPLSALLLLGGALGDKLGRRRMFAVGIAVFAIASVACGLALDAASLVVGRAIQGLGAAMMIPGSLSMISAVFHGGARGAAIGTWSALTAVTTAVGPPMGGWLADTAGWRWIFFINVPFALIALWVLYRHAPESRSDDPDRRLDWPGALTIALALGGMVLGLVTAGAEGFGAPLAIAALLVGGAALVAFIFVERRSDHPMVPLRVFANPTFAAITAITLLLYASLSGGLFYLPFNLIQFQGYTVLEAAAALLPFVALIAILSRLSGGFAARHGGRVILTLGGLMVAGAMVWLGGAGRGADYWLEIGPPLALMGIGMGFCAAPISMIAMSALPDSQVGLASGINNAVARVATLLAIAGLGLVLAFAFAAGLDTGGQGWSSAADAVIAQSRARLLDVVISDIIPPDEADRLVDRLAAAYEDGFATLMWAAAALATLAALIAGLGLRKSPS